jgi:group II intron reverse transcriptase/maturase
MSAAQTAVIMSPGLLKVIDRAKRDPEVSFTSLAHLLDEGALERAFRRLRNDAAVGVDGITKEKYGEALAVNLRDLHRRLREGRYRHQPIRRVHIPKDKGRTRPIGISTIEDKIVQSAITEVLGAVYEPIFSESSYGFRPRRSAHDALRSLNKALLAGVSWVLEADIESFFDSINRTMLMEMLRHRVADGALLRLVGKCLHVGVLDGEEFSTPDEGTVQGSVLSPMLGNVFLHHVLDAWVEREVRPRLRGAVHLVRYADDFVLGFEREEDARRVMDVLPRRFARYGLTLHPEKTRLLPFTRPRKGSPQGKGPATFDFLGFTIHWAKRRSGTWTPGLKTRTARLRRAITAVADWCRRHRHRPVKEQHAALRPRLLGHYNYYGVNGNIRSLRVLAQEAARAWYKWLRRRSQRSRLTRERFLALLRDFPLPVPKIRVQIWQPLR